MYQCYKYNLSNYLGILLKMCLIVLFGLSTAYAGDTKDKKDDAKQRVGAALEAYAVDGFRNAKFARTEAQVMKVIQKDLGVTKKNIKEVNNIDKTRSLLITNHKLAPAKETLADIAYIFGYKSKKLIQVNVVWKQSKDDKADKDKENRDLTATGLLLSNYFRGYGWAEDSIRAGRLESGEILLFSAREIEGDGVIQVILWPGDEERPENIAYLKLSYIDNGTSPDIFRIKTGDF